MSDKSTMGRLVVVAERRLSAESRGVLRVLLEELCRRPEVTFVAGLERGAMLEAGAEGGKVFYNTKEYIPFGEVVGLVPWREVWLVAAGRVWRAQGCC
ncbi:MAG: hypothetical protein GC129_03335 [Proteobacteria bacterium]|nr:hypothetical protein [Pseudomonadota bacterium]